MAWWKSDKMPYKGYGMTDFIWLALAAAILMALLATMAEKSVKNKKEKGSDSMTQPGKFRPMGEKP